MPTVVTERPYRPVPMEPPRKRWTRSECLAMEATGVWDQQNLELVEGELISKMGKKRPHTNTLIVVQAWLIRVFGEQYVNPETRAGIVEYWVVDVAARRLVVHRDPANGLYQSVTVYNDRESVSPLAAQGSEFRVAEAMGADANSHPE